MYAHIVFLYDDMFVLTDYFTSANRQTKWIVAHLKIFKNKNLCENVDFYLWPRLLNLQSLRHNTET